MKFNALYEKLLEEAGSKFTHGRKLFDDLMDDMVEAAEDLADKSVRIGRSNPKKLKDEIAEYYVATAPSDIEDDDDLEDHILTSLLGDPHWIKRWFEETANNLTRNGKEKDQDIKDLAEEFLNRSAGNKELAQAMKAVLGQHNLVKRSYKY
jgi:DNA-binding ferritin-like protein